MKCLDYNPKTGKFVWKVSIGNRAKIGEEAGASSQQNAVNRDAYDNQAGAAGVYRKGNKYCTKIKVNSKQIHLGTFETLEEASKVYQEARIKYFGEFGNV